MPMLFLPLDNESLKALEKRVKKAYLRNKAYVDRKMPTSSKHVIPITMLSCEAPSLLLGLCNRLRQAEKRRLIAV